MNQSTNGKPQPPEGIWVYPEFQENFKRFPVEELRRYEGKHVAWTLDGTRIVAEADGYGELWDKVESMGMDPQRVVYDFVDYFCRPMV